MGSPLGPTLANAFLVYLEKNWLQNCPSAFKSHYYRQYIDDTFVLFTSPEHLESFRNFLNGRQVIYNWEWNAEWMEWNQMECSFLMFRLFVKIKTFTTSVYRKPIFSGVYTHFYSFSPSAYKFGAVYTLTYRCFLICSFWIKLHT